MKRKQTHLTLLIITLLITSTKLFAIAPVRVAPAYEDSLRVLIGFHVGTSLCMYSGGRGQDLLDLVVRAIDTSRVDKTEIQFLNDDLFGFSRFTEREIPQMWDEQLPHVMVWISGDHKVTYYANKLGAWFHYASENKIGFVTIGPPAIHGSTFMSDTAAALGNAPFFDGRWLLDQNDSVFIHLKPIETIPSSRQYYPNVNGVVRNTMEYVMPGLGMSGSHLYCKPFGGAGRCKMPGLTLSDDKKSNFTAVAFQQGFNDQDDVVFDFARDAEGNIIRDENKVYQFEEIPAPAGYVGGDEQYQAITVYEDTISTFLYDGNAVKRDPRQGDPVVRRSVNIHFNPGYLQYKAAAEQLVYDAIMYASTTHLIGQEKVIAEPPENLPVPVKQLSVKSVKLKDKNVKAKRFTINGKMVGNIQTKRKMNQIYVVQYQNGMSKKVLGFGK